MFRRCTPQQEVYLTQQFRLRATGYRDTVPGESDLVGWVSLMQHYGLPTRLLDWTESLLVAAWFATEPELRQTAVWKARDAGRNGRVDAAVWVLAPGTLNNRQKRLFYGVKQDVYPILQLGQPEAVYYLYWPFAGYERKSESPSPMERVRALRLEDELLVCAVLAPPFDRRMVAQSSTFTLHNRGTHSCAQSQPAVPLEKGFGDLPAGRFLAKLVIAHDGVETVREQLYGAGVRRSQVFPDLDHLAADIRDEIGSSRFG